MKNLLWIAVVLICSCNPLKKAQDQFKLHPDDFAGLSARYFPCRDTAYVRDSVRLDTLYLQPEPVTTVEYRSDTLFKTITVPGTTRFITKYITKDSIVIRRDNAAEAMLRSIIDQKEKTTSDAVAQYASLKESSKWWKTACLITWGVLAAYLIGWIVSKIYGRKV